MQMAAPTVNSCRSLDAAPCGGWWHQRPGILPQVFERVNVLPVCAGIPLTSLALAARGYMPGEPYRGALVATDESVRTYGEAYPSPWRAQLQVAV